MRQAKVLLVVCAGIFLLAFAYHFGARSAEAQSTTDVECVGVEDQYGCAVVNHRLYVGPYDYGMIPGPARAVACGALTVLLEDGTVWTMHGTGAWHQGASLPFSSFPTPAQSISIGQLKAKYAN
jgi:hypothetical protein